jgi:hypothetical protein
MSSLNLKLHPKQAIGFKSLATEIFYGGAAGGGKSHLLRVLAIYFCCAIPGLQVYLFRRKHTDLLKNHMAGPKSFPVLLADAILSRHVQINWGDLQIKFANGSVIYLCHCQHEKDVYNYQGAEIHLLLIDELTHFLEPMYRFLRGRARVPGLIVPERFKGLFPRIVCGGNPGGIGHNFVKLSFVDNAPELEIKRMPKEEGGMLRQFVPALLEDNPTLLEDDPEYEDRLEGLGNPTLVKAMRRGIWDIVAGGMFDDLWDRSKHVIKPFAIPDSWYIDRSFDWGSSHPFSVNWWAESDGTKAPNGKHYPRGSIFLFSEWYGWNGKANEGCKMLATEVADGILEREKAWKYKVRPGPADSSIFDTENGNCIAADMAKRGVRWTIANKAPGTRKQGWEMMRKMLKAATAERAEEPGLYAFDHCTQWIRTVPTLIRDEKNMDDVNTKAEDHAGDSTRYRILGVRKGNAY